jgi:DNA polymerase V
MGFPVPGDAIEQSLDLNRYLIHNPAATFFLRVAGDAVVDAEVGPGDLLIVDRSQSVQPQSLVVGVIAGQMKVFRMPPPGPSESPSDGSATAFEIWGVVTHIIRKV